MFKDRADLVNQLAQFEAGRSEARVGDLRQIFKLLIEFDAHSMVNGQKSVLIMLRREARAMAVKIKAKRKKKK